MQTSSIEIFIGHFGSGKTETAINHALKAASEGKKTVLVDIDIVNPFFRSSEVKALLQERQIELISPNTTSLTMSLPSLPPTILSVFNRESTEVIFDVGGDEEGAKVLSGYRAYFEKSGYRMNFVLNTKRPFTKTAEDAAAMIKAIEKSSRLKVTDIISNSNLASETTLEDILEGIKVSQELSSVVELPIRHINAAMPLYGQVKEAYNGTINAIELYMTPDHNGANFI